MAPLFPNPPAIKTRPSGSRVAVARSRALAIDPGGGKAHGRGIEEFRAALQASTAIAGRTARKHPSIAEERRHGLRGLDHGALQRGERSGSGDRRFRLTAVQFSGTRIAARHEVPAACV